MWSFLVLIVIIILLFLNGFFLVRQQEAIIIERLGRFHRIVEAGFRFKVPFIDRKVATVSLRTMKEGFNLDAKTTKQLTLAIEEAMVNAMTYAYPADTRGSITLEAESDGKHLKFILTDSGNPFDPTSVREADTSSSLDDRPIGGLGIFLVRQLMDSINYERTNGKNILTIQKKLTIKQ